MAADVLAACGAARGCEPCELWPCQNTCKRKPYPPRLCMQFDSQWDTHPDNGDQCGFIKPNMRLGDDLGAVCVWGGAFRWFSLPYMGGERACIFPGKNTEESIPETGGLQ